MLRCTRGCCKADATWLKCVGLKFVEDEEPQLLFRCKGCGSEQWITLSRFNEELNG